MIPLTSKPKIKQVNQIVQSENVHIKIGYQVAHKGYHNNRQIIVMSKYGNKFLSCGLPECAENSGQTYFRNTSDSALAKKEQAYVRSFF